MVGKHGARASTSAETWRRWEAFVDAYVALRSSDRALLRDVIEADPGWAVGHAAAAVASQLHGYTEFDAQSHLAQAVDGRAAADWELSLVAAARRSIERGQWSAYPRWLEHQRAFPADLFGWFVMVSLTHVSGDAAGDRLTEERSRMTLNAVGEQPGVLGWLALTVVDRGGLDEATELTGRSLAIDPAGLAGGHSQAHVYFESGAHSDGLAWLDAWLPNADAASPLAGHLQWHAALHHLALDQPDDALGRYRACGAVGAPGRLVDASSLLWRCQLRSDVPPATDPVQPPIGRSVRGLMDAPPSLFSGVHVALALATAGDSEGLRRYADTVADVPAPGTALVPPLAIALAELVEGNPDAAAHRLLGAETTFVRLGGSRAQREVWEDTLIEALMRAGHSAEAGERLERRLDRRPNPHDSVLLARTAQS